MNYNSGCYHNPGAYTAPQDQSSYSASVYDAYLIANIVISTVTMFLSAYPYFRMHSSCMRKKKDSEESEDAGCCDFSFETTKQEQKN